MSASWIAFRRVPSSGVGQIRPPRPDSWKRLACPVTTSFPTRLPQQREWSAYADERIRRRRIVTSAGLAPAGVPPDNVHHRVLAKAHVAGNEPIGHPVGMHAEHPLGFLVRGTLTQLAPDAPGPSRCQAGFAEMRIQ